MEWRWDLLPSRPPEANTLLVRETGLSRPVFVEVRARFAEVKATFAEVLVEVLQKPSKEGRSLSRTRWQKHIKRCKAIPGNLNANAKQDKCYDTENTMGS